MQAVVTTAMLAAGLMVGAVPATAAPTVTTLRVGTLDLTRCRLAGVAAWCGQLAVPLDRTDPASPRITIGFGWLPATTAGARTIVAQEGGPGYPSTGTTADYVDLFGADLLSSHNLLVVDDRGTGRSTPIDCPALQHGLDVTTDVAYLAAAAACGRRLDHTFRRADGTYVAASDLFTTANGARDLAAVLRALEQQPVDLYGDSYGTFFAQAFLARYPELVRSVVLDSAYEARDLDPWYRTSATTARSAFQAVCDRQPTCQQAGGEAPWARIGRLLTALRVSPVTGRAPSPDGTLHEVTVDVTALVDLVNDAGYDVGTYRELDAAAGAWLDRHDPTPLLRLWAQDLDWDYSTSEVADYSQGQYQAVSCADYPQLFDLRATQADRRRQLAAAVAALPARTFAPFTTTEWLQLSPNVQPYTACLSWPAPTHPDDPPVPVGAAMNPRHVPVLILNGDLDSLTPAPGGAHIALQIGRGARHVVVRNMNHLVGLVDPYGCGRGIVQRFLVDPARLSTLDTSCRTTVPPLGIVTTFPGSLATTTPAAGDGPPALRRLATVAAGVAADVAHRATYLDGARDNGLYGGTSRTAGGRSTVTGWLWVPDVAGTGTVTVDGLTGSAVLTLVIAAGTSTRCTVQWQVTGPFGDSTTTCAGRPFRTPGF